MGHILLVAEAVTLAHVARPLALARIFEELGHEVTIACSPSARRWLEGEGRPFIAIESISQRQFLNAIYLGKPVFDTTTLKRHVAADLALISRVRPDIVVGDFRLSLHTSCKVANVPYGNVTNAYWSARFFQCAQAPDIPLTRAVGPKLGSVLFRAVHRPAFAWHARAYAQIARFYGVPPPPGGLLGAYTASDCTAYADLAALYDAPQSPSPSELFIGPLQWSPKAPLPATHAAWGLARPLVYVTPGSSGSTQIIGRCLDALADLDVDVVVSTAGAKVAAPPANASIMDFAPGDELCAVASLVIGNGGSPITYQALRAGAPILGLVSNLDQFLNMERIEAANMGLGMRAANASIADIRRAAMDLLDNPVPRGAAARAKSALAALPATESVRSWLRRLAALASSMRA